MSGSIRAKCYGLRFFLKSAISNRHTATSQIFIKCPPIPFINLYLYLFDSDCFTKSYILSRAAYHYFEFSRFNDIFHILIP